MDPNTQAYYRSALKLKMPVVLNKHVDGFNVQLGKRNYYFFSTMTPFNNAANLYLVNSKYATNSILKEANIPVPEGKFLLASKFNYETLVELTSTLKFPTVVKPNSWTHSGLDVICGIPNIHVLFNKCEMLFKDYDELIIEEYHGNLHDYRILVFRNKILDVVARFPAKVIGNGEDTIDELVKQENTLRLEKSNILLPIEFDFEADMNLLNQGLTKESVPEIGKEITLGYTCNASRGGTVKAIPKEICKENEELFLKFARVLDLEFVGIDVCCKSLMEPITSTGGVFIEANVVPSVRIHEDGLGGEKKGVTLELMKTLVYRHPFSYLYSLVTRNKNYYSLVIHLIILTGTIAFSIFFLLRFIKNGALWIP